MLVTGMGGMDKIQSQLLVTKQASEEGYYASSHHFSFGRHQVTFYDNLQVPNLLYRTWFTYSTTPQYALLSSIYNT